MACESAVTRKFIHEHYPEVIWRRDYKVGFIQNIGKHKGMLPTIYSAYCCANYKHNKKYIDNSSIIGVRRAESRTRSNRQVFESKGKRFDARHDSQIAQYFSEKCRGIGSVGDIQLMPIVDWSDEDVWEYIMRESLPVNPEYKHHSRVGCVCCPKANLNSNAYYLLKHPKLIDAFIRQRDKFPVDWIITGDKKDYSDNKPLYIIRWLNHSFAPFTARNQKLADEILKKYNELHKNNT